MKKYQDYEKNLFDAVLEEIKPQDTSNITESWIEFEALPEFEKSLREYYDYLSKEMPAARNYAKKYFQAYLIKE